MNTQIAKLTAQQIDLCTCLECCKYYIAPETAACGHTLCHYCWRLRRTCPYCGKSFERTSLKHNQVIQRTTEHVQALGEAFEKLFKVNLNEFLDMDTGDEELENDPTKIVKDWLTSSQNCFSVPPQNSEQSSSEMQLSNPLNVSLNKIQIHSNAPKTKSPAKVVLVSVAQDDWDKIETMPDTEEITKNKENIVGPMDIEPFYVDDSEYTVANPRRSSRKKESKPTEAINKTSENNSLERKSSKNSSVEIDKKSSKAKQNWNNVKKMRKEFSKLGKRNRSKLNVSIEMCKKTQPTAKANVAMPQASQVYDIEENTPGYVNIEKQNGNEKIAIEYNNDEEDKNANASGTINVETNKNAVNETQELSLLNALKTGIINIPQNRHIQETNAVTQTTHSSKPEETTECKVLDKAALRPKEVEANIINTINHNIETNTASDDIEITIKMGNRITNILIKKNNEVDVKVVTDREVQTTLGPFILPEKHNSSAQNTEIQNTDTKRGEIHTVDVRSQSNASPKIKEQKKASVKTVSDKKNTDSADTATAHFEITESVEKELSKVMECVNDSIKLKNTPVVEDNCSVTKKSHKSGTNVDDLEHINDLDIFEGESVKESGVKLLKDVEHATSEILHCTVKTKHRTQKNIEKRVRDAIDLDAFPNSKKAKLDNSNNVIAIETKETDHSKQNQNESETMNYDTIIDKVFASIDADIEEIHESQNIGKKICIMSNSKKQISHHQLNDKNKDTQEIASKMDCSAIIQENYIQKDSENVFSVSVTHKEDDNVDAAPTKDKMPPNVPQPNIEDFLTPVLCRHLESTEDNAVDSDIEMIDDCDKSVFEETPQKTSFTNIKQKNISTNKQTNLTQIVELSQPKGVSSEKKSNETTNKNMIISLIDTSTEINSNKEITVVEHRDKRSLETPLTINKFVNQITHKSTPLAKKSLSFDTENMDTLDPEQTICPSNETVARTTQEKEIMSKAFEKTPTLPVKLLGLRNLGLRNKKYCIAGSCLTPAQIQKVKLLCARHKFTYVDTFCNDLTHLVVSVDEERKSQRSVKFMCALASSKWIVAYDWVEKCLQSTDIVGEKVYEALDNTGEPGPMRSRLAARKLFEGITFFCMEPFKLLDLATLKTMLEAAGGRVVEEVKEVRVTEKSVTPALLLAELENTQEDKYIYLAMQLSIVPVNLEWAMNCLGSYTLCSIQDLLLCPSTLLPKGIESWPQVLIARDDE